MRGRPETLFWGLLVLLGAGWLLLVGCGSESPPGPSGRGEGKQQAASQEPGAGPARTIPLPPRLTDRDRARLREALGPGLHVGPPPVGPGGVGLTEAELRSGPPPLDPEACEIGPPLKNGERGITLGKLLAAPRKSIDPEVFEVSPPLRPGERGMTQAELERRLRNHGPPP